MRDAGRQVGVLVIEDDAIVRAWVRLALESSEFRVAGEATNAEEALAFAERRWPDMLLVDYRLPDLLGTQLVRELRLRGIGAPAVLISARSERGLNEAAREAGIQVTVHKRGNTEELVDALRRAQAGSVEFDPDHPRRPQSEVGLSARERQVLRLVAGGSTNIQAAAELRISVETVKTLLERVYRKLGVRRRAEAVAVAKERALI